MSDPVERAAVIDELWRISDEYRGSVYATSAIHSAFAAVKALPSTETEIIRCKDCLIHGVCRFEQGLGLDGYCSQAERRTDE